VARSARHAGRVWLTIDPSGREILLTPARWLHILIRHGELKPHRDAVLAAVSDPDLIRLGNEPNERWFFAANTGPSRWLQVVVHYDEGSGRITTAFGRRWLP
jgi:hypothetical protein